MNKKLLVAIISILLLIGGGFAYLLTSSDAQEELDTMKSDETSAQQAEEPKSTEPEAAKESVAEPTATPTTTTQSQAGSYQAYTADAVSKSESTNLLFFHASWCPQCRQLDADITAKGAPNGVAIFKVDYDSNQTLRKKYGVTLQTTVVRIDASGNLVEKFVAYDSPTLQAVKDALL